MGLGPVVDTRFPDVVVVVADTELTPETITGSSESRAIAAFCFEPVVDVALALGAFLMKLGNSLLRRGPSLAKWS